VSAVPVEGLYEGTVPGDSASAGRTAIAAEALKQVVVRLTGRQSAATDPALASLYGDPIRFASTYRSAAPGEVAVGFDAGSLDTALLGAGQRLWGRDRPVTLVLVVAPRPGVLPSLATVDPELRREIERTARERGLPLAWPGAIDAAALQPRYADAIAGRLEPLLALARQSGADGVLLGRVLGAGVTWAWSGPAGEGGFAGAAADAVRALADRYGAQFASQSAAKSGALAVTVRGVRDLAGYAAASQALAGAEGVRDVALDEAKGDALAFRLSFAGDAAGLRQALQGSRLVPDDEAPADGGVHLVLRP